MKIMARLMLCVLVLSLLVSLSATIVGASPGLNVAVYGVEWGGNSWRNDVKSKLEGTGLFDTVDAYNIVSWIPSLTDLQNYDAVLVYTNGAGCDGTTLGNNLADYMDGGGGVVLTTFAYYSSTGMAILGRIKTDGYLPFTTADQAQSIQLFLVADIPGHEILNGVTSFDGGSSSFHNSSISTVPGATQIAHWTNGQPLVAAYQPTAGRIVGLNFFPPSSDVRSDFWNSATDGDLLMANALVYTAGGVSPPPPPPGIPSISQWGMLAAVIILGILIVYMVRTRRSIVLKSN